MSNDSPKVPHYYGDVVRRLFLVAAIIMLVTLPFFNDRLPISSNLSLLIIVVLAIFAGATNPVKIMLAVIDVMVSIIGAAAFEYYAVQFYITFSPGDFLFWINQGLAVIFIFALYFSTKTLRGMLLDRRS